MATLPNKSTSAATAAILGLVITSPGALAADQNQPTTSEALAQVESMPSGMTKEQLEAGAKLLSQGKSLKVVIKSGKSRKTYKLTKTGLSPKPKVVPGKSYTVRVKLPGVADPVQKVSVPEVKAAPRAIDGVPTAPTVSISGTTHNLWGDNGQRAYEPFVGGPYRLNNAYDQNADPPNYSTTFFAYTAFQMGVSAYLPNLPYPNIFVGVTAKIIAPDESPRCVSDLGSENPPQKQFITYKVNGGAWIYPKQFCYTDSVSGRPYNFIGTGRVELIPFGLTTMTFRTVNVANPTINSTDVQRYVWWFPFMFEWFG